jgi:hypothetical protein
MSTLLSVCQSAVTCYLNTCSYGTSARILCRQDYPVEGVSLWCDLLHKFVFIWILCQVYLQSIVPCHVCMFLVDMVYKHVSIWNLCEVYLPSVLHCRACISLVWPVTYVRIHMDSVSGVTAIRSTLWCVYLTGVTCDIIKFSYGHCVRCFCHQVYTVECVSVWWDLLYNYVFIWTLCQVYLSSILPCRGCISLVWPVT